MKRIFLTGASSGIGLAVARALVAGGHEVWGTAREIKRLPVMPRMHAVALDLSDRHSLTEGFRTALGEAGHFDVVINNAGAGHFGPAESLSHEDLAHCFQILLFAEVELMRLALDSMSDCEGGLIINVTSLAARLPVPFMAAYNAAKAALASYTMTMQIESQNRNVRFVDLQPGDINTPFNDAVSKTASDDPRTGRIWQVIDRNMKAAPPPEVVAARVVRLIAQKNPPPRVSAGGFFQAAVAPFIFRFLPQRMRVWGLKNYYGI